MGLPPLDRGREDRGVVADVPVLGLLLAAPEHFLHLQVRAVKKRLGLELAGEEGVGEMLDQILVDVLELDRTEIVVARDVHHFLANVSPE